MKREMLFEAIGEIEDVYVKEAREVQGNKKIKWAAWGIAAAACLCLVLGSIYALRIGRVEDRWRVVTIHVPVSEKEGQVMETAPVLRWEDMAIYQQYGWLEWDGKNYDSRSPLFFEGRLGEFMGTSIAKGEDVYAELAGEDGERQIEVNVYAITDISEECAVAVQYDGVDEWYVFVNSFYRPRTLGEFIEALNLRNEITFGIVDYNYWKDSGEYATVLFDDVDSDMIWKLLLSAAESENVFDETRLHEIPPKVIDISVSIPLLGYQNISLSVHEEGYIVTNILDTGKMFYVGEENTEAFIKYVLEECDGYEVIYVYDGEEDIPDDEEFTVIEHYMDGREDVITIYDRNSSEEDVMTSPSMPGQCNE